MDPRFNKGTELKILDRCHKILYLFWVSLATVLNLKKVDFRIEHTEIRWKKKDSPSKG